MNAADLAVFDALFASVAEEMGAALERAATSTNIKERRDLSCAVFDDEGHRSRDGRRPGAGCSSPWRRACAASRIASASRGPPAMADSRSNLRNACRSASPSFMAR